MSDIFKAYDGAGGGSGGDDAPPAGPSPAHGDAEASCPLTPLGRLAGKFYFLDIAGELRELTARALSNRPDLVSLFLGSKTWLEIHFPSVRVVKLPDGGERVDLVGFSAAAAGEFLQAMCGRAGMFGDHITARRPGIWAAADGTPILHCGDEVFLDGAWKAAGWRKGNTIWPLAPPTRRPAEFPAGPEIGADLVATLRKLWRFHVPGGEILAIGLIGTALLGAAARWRPNGFLIGDMGAGKSQLLKLMTCLCPMQFSTNDTTKAGLEQNLDGRAMPMFVDEAADRQNQNGAKALMDIVLSSTGGDGGKVTRGTADGAGRSVAILGAIIMASTAPPDMLPAHLSRFSIIRLVAPEAGEDHSAEMAAAIEAAERDGPALWARVLARHADWRAALAVFRVALGEAGCAAREMDQIGAQLAGYWVVTRDGVPSAADAKQGVKRVEGYIVGAVDGALESAPRLVLAQMLSTRVHLSSSGQQLPIAELLARAWENAFDADGQQVGRVAADFAARELLHIGIRVVRVRDYEQVLAPPTPPRPPPPRGERLDPIEGIWLGNRSAPLLEIFAGTDWAGQRWRWALGGIAIPSPSAVRIGPGAPQRALWLSRAQIENVEGVTS